MKNKKPGIHEAINKISSYSSLGLFNDFKDYIENLAPTIRKHPKAALAITRCFLRQGDIMASEQALAATDVNQCSPGDLLLQELESASLGIFKDLKINEALRRAETALTNATKAEVAPEYLVEARRIQTRIFFIGTTYFEIPQYISHQTYLDLPEIAMELEQLGKFDEALSTWLTYASRSELATLTKIQVSFSDKAQAWYRLDALAEFLLIKAAKMIDAHIDRREIAQVLDKANAIYLDISHGYGTLEAERIRTRLNLDYEGTPPEEWKSCLDGFQNAGYYRGVINTLMDLSQYALQTGALSSSKKYRDRLLSLSEEVGMGMVQDNFRFGRVDLLMRQFRHGDAIELCEAALSEELPRFTHAMYEQMLASAHSFLNNAANALEYGGRAIRGFEQVGAEDSASDAVLKHAADLNAFRDDTFWDRALKMLKEWVNKDQAREDISAKVGKKELIAQIHIQRYLYSATLKGRDTLLDEAEKEIISAEEEASKLKGFERAKSLANLQQLRGQLTQLRDDWEGVYHAWKTAMDLYQEAGLGMEIANCQYMLGVLHLNRANQQLQPNFGISERHLQDAIGYYQNSGMRSQAMDARYMKALLYTNTSFQMQDQDIKDQLLDAAMELLIHAESDADAIRRDFDAGMGVLAVRKGKMASVGNSHRIYELGSDILFRLKPDPIHAWHWIQRAKSRNLSDILGMSTLPPARILKELEGFPKSLALVEEEQALNARIRIAEPTAKVKLKEKRDQLQQKMASDPHLEPYLDVRLGKAVEGQDALDMMAPLTENGRTWACIDWSIVKDRLYLTVLRSNGDVHLSPLQIGLKELQDRLFFDFDPSHVRSSLMDTPGILRQYDELIRPLVELTVPEELLVFSPMGPIHALPLHALDLNGTTLIERNPIIYASGLSILRHCISRGGEEINKDSVSILGDPSADRESADELVIQLGKLFNSKPLRQKEVNRKNFLEAVKEVDIFHFQGHALHNRMQPLDSYLKLSDCKMTASQVFDLIGLKAELVTLAACESGANAIEPGDEPMGLIPAFLYAGAQSVLATLWKVNQRSAARVMSRFYQSLKGGKCPLAKAMALREAILETKKEAKFQSPYHWAPFVLHGKW